MMRLYDVILRVVVDNAPNITDPMMRHRLVDALERELRRGDTGWVTMRKPPPRRNLFGLRRRAR